MPLTRPRRLSAALLVAAFGVAAGPLSSLAADENEQSEKDIVVARVGDEEIRISEIVSRVLTEQRNQGQRNQSQDDFDALYNRFLEERINRLLIVKAARESGLQDDPLHIQRLARMEQQLLSELFLQREIVLRVSPEAVRDRYDQIVAETEGKEQVKVRHIVVESQERAAELRTEITAGADFVETAKGLTFPGAEQGGDLGWFGEGQVLPAIANAALAAETGVVTEPVQSPFGWHLILVEDRRPVPINPFEEVEDHLFRQLSEEARDAIVADLRETTAIELFKRDGTPVAAD